MSDFLFEMRDKMRKAQATDDRNRKIELVSICASILCGQEHFDPINAVGRAVTIIELAASEVELAASEATE